MTSAKEIALGIVYAYITIIVLTAILAYFGITIISNPATTPPPK